ncbi:B-box zinc finger protein [Paenibacillus sp. FSL M8-0142]|uniref:B box-type domain-containing protein n=2 Tax=Paenibacillus lactis TaxID=228574 RepID=G4HJ76_9BACL|nr:hypothetical protein PaelaDRAFT_4037 [Paenibacillus lactis 154]
MDVYRCMNHPEAPAIGQCRRCGKPICKDCYNLDNGCCRYRCGEIGYAPHTPPRPKSAFWSVIVSLLAILGGLAVLLLAICGAMLFSY